MQTCKYKTLSLKFMGRYECIISGPSCSGHSMYWLYQRTLEGTQDNSCMKCTCISHSKCDGKPKESEKRNIINHIEDTSRNREFRQGHARRLIRHGIRGKKGEEEFVTLLCCKVEYGKQLTLNFRGELHQLTAPVQILVTRKHLKENKIKYCYETVS